MVVSIKELDVAASEASKLLDRIHKVKKAFKETEGGLVMNKAYFGGRETAALKRTAAELGFALLPLK